MKTINFYELLELVKDGKAPKKINFDSRGWVFQGNQYSAIDGDGANIWSGYNFNILNDEVEIIEEDKPTIAREELENRIENALEFLETQYNTFPSGEMWRKALKNVLKGKEPDDVYKPFLEEDKKIEKLNDILRVDDLEPPYDCNLEKIWVQTIKNHNKINELIDKVNSLENKQ